MKLIQMKRIATVAAAAGLFTMISFTSAAQAAPSHQATPFVETTYSGKQASVMSLNAESVSNSTATANTYTFAAQVAELVNQERSKAGLKALVVDTSLQTMAQDKAADMNKNNYFSHTSPTYGSPFDMMRTYKINYRAAGENIAKGQTSPAQVMNSWMNSPGHKANILSQNFTHIGVGYVNGIWVQEFIGK